MYSHKIKCKVKTAIPVIQYKPPGITTDNIKLSTEAYTKI